MNVTNYGASESSIPLDALETTDSEEALAFGPNDVLSGRNKLSFNHIGNRRFREVVAQSIDDYNTAQSRAEKYGIVETIMSHIAKSGGRFLKQADDGSWQELEPETVRQKIAHAIRDTTKKREQKARKKENREAATKAQRVLSHPATVVTPASREPSRQADHLSHFVQDLNKYMKKNRTSPQSTTASSARRADPIEMKNFKPQPEESKLPPPRRGLGLGMDMPTHQLRNELRQEPEQNMLPLVGFEMRNDLGHRIRAQALGPQPSLYGRGRQRQRPLSAPGLDPRPQLPSAGLALGLGLRETFATATRQFSLPDLRVAHDFGLGQQFDVQPDYEVFSEPIMGPPIAPDDLPIDPPGELPIDPPGAQEDDFMRKIDDTLGPEPDVH